MSVPHQPAGMNPYNTLLTATTNNPTHITTVYETHRLTRLAQQRAHLTSPTFPGLTPDPILSRLLHEDSLPPSQRSGFSDNRHNIVLWARPPSRVRCLIGEIQERLNETGLDVYLQPAERLHLTVFEVAHSLSAEGQVEVLGCIPDGLVREAVELPAEMAGRREGKEKGRKRREGKMARVGRPMVVYDDRAVAVCWVPVGSPENSTGGLHWIDGEVDGGKGGMSAAEGEGEKCYTYHHLRRDLWTLFNDQGVPVASRYVLPSCHMTIARFVSYADVTDVDRSDVVEKPTLVKLEALDERVDEINEWLDAAYAGEKGEWVVAEEKGLDFRVGTCWYGGGETVRLGSAVDVV